MADSTVPPFKALGDALRHARETAGFTQQEAARELGTTQAQMHRYESGKRQAPVAFVQLAEARYGVRILATDLQPGGVSRETVRSLRERPTHPYRAQALAPADLRGALWAIEQMSLALADISRRAREATE
jgi:transcriptional regulator with XRE-family HTH domain